MQCRAPRAAGRSQVTGGLDEAPCKVRSPGAAGAPSLPACPHPAVPGWEASAHPSCKTHPSCPPKERPMLRSPTATWWRGPGDRQENRGSLNPSGQQEGGSGEGSWVFLFMIKWVHQAPWAGLGGKSGFWRWGEAGQAWGYGGCGGGLGADEAGGGPAQGHGFGRGRGGVVVGETFPSARHGGGRWGLGWMGWGGAPCLGLVTLGYPLPVHPPKMAVRGGAGVGLGRRVGVHPVSPA